MAQFQQHFSSLSELERLEALTKEKHLLKDIGPEEWPLAMLACALHSSDDEQKLQHSLEIYQIFCEQAKPQARAQSLKQLQQFLYLRKGASSLALLPYILRDDVALISRQAALILISHAPPSENERFSGIAELIALLQQRPEAPSSILAALLSLADLRFEPMLQSLAKLPNSELTRHIEALDEKPNRLLYNWLMSILQLKPELNEVITQALIKSAKKGGRIIDLVLPIPCWAYGKPQAQELHGWELPEYFPRILPQIRPHLREEQIQAIARAHQLNSFGC